MENLGCGYDAVKAKPRRTQSTVTGDSRPLETLRLSKSLLMTSSTSYSLKRQSWGVLRDASCEREEDAERKRGWLFFSSGILRLLSLQPRFHKRHGTTRDSWAQLGVATVPVKCTLECHRNRGALLGVATAPVKCTLDCHRNPRALLGVATVLVKFTLDCHWDHWDPGALLGVATAPMKCR